MKIFVIGASGFIGGSVAVNLLNNGHIIKGLVRSSRKAQQLTQIGIEPILGELSDNATISREAKWADVIINAASSDNYKVVENIINTIAGSGKIFLHTSGTSLVGDDAKGQFSSSQVFDEETPINPHKDKAARVALDRFILDSVNHDIKPIILCNSLIYGYGFGVNTDSVQIPRLVSQAKKSGIARHVGRGLNIWSNVHIKDVADLYLLALERAKPGSFYFVENGRSSFTEITQAIATKLSLGLAQDWSIEEAINEWGYEHATYGLGCNSIVSANKARTELGWNPKYNSITKWIMEELV
ncbi:MAG: dependent epimerase/dehydratase family protein [Burkholderiales bacterium]|jgi:nucleoside-diphosphate-sugar epimerase|nr:dependent epimerase/dehydratase family protein [Burkholderiales bacterium]